MRRPSTAQMPPKEIRNCRIHEDSLTCRIKSYSSCALRGGRSKPLQTAMHAIESKLLSNDVLRYPSVWPPPFPPRLIGNVAKMSQWQTNLTYRARSAFQ